MIGRDVHISTVMFARPDQVKICKDELVVEISGRPSDDYDYS